MTRTILIVSAIIIIGWFALKDQAYTFLIGEAANETEAPDYYYDEVWLERPASQTSGGWGDPWGVDLFIVAPPVSSPVRKGLLPAEHEALEKEYADFIANIGLTDADIEIYTPAYRSPSPASTGRKRDAEIQRSQSDMQDAMKRYLSAENRMRGLIILAAPDSESLLYAALSQLPDTQAFRERFGGVFVPEGKNASRWEDYLGSCSPAFAECVVTTSVSGKPSSISWLTPNLPHRSQAYSADSDFLGTIHTRVQTLSSWLDLNAEKPAEPFDTWAADEVVDVAPIHRPNPDEDISGERGD